MKDELEAVYYKPITDEIILIRMPYESITGSYCVAVCLLDKYYHYDALFVEDLKSYEQWKLIGFL